VLSVPDRARLGAAAEALGEFGDPVALGPPDAVWVDVTGLGERLEAMRERLSQMGLAARVAVSDTPFRARALARHGRPDAPPDTLPIALADLDERTAARLRTLGVRTLGDLARLPLQSLAPRFGAGIETAWRGARGEPGPPLVRFEPTGPIVETMDLDTPVETLEPLRFTLKTLLDRACARLRGRGVGATSLSLELRPDGAQPVRLTLDLAAPLCDVSLLHALCIERVCRVTLDRPLSGLTLEVLRTAPRRRAQADLFAPPAPKEDPAVTLSRVAAAAGDPPRAAELRERYRPEEAYTLQPFSPDARPGRTPPPPAPRPTRLLGEPRRLAIDPSTWPSRCALAGPERLVGEWWDEPLARDYYVVPLHGGRAWVFRDLATGDVYLHGWFD
jgi:protein ImuB